MGFSACLSLYVSPEGTNFRPEKNHISWTCHFDIKPDNPIEKIDSSATQHITGWCSITSAPAAGAHKPQNLRGWRKWI